jgi:phosphatidate cytidylyltransferase
VAHLVTGFLYGSVGLTAACALRQMHDGLAWVIASLVITWSNDTSAYFAGRFLGRHKLYPEVSPNKTWEGFAGGMLGSIAGMFIARGFFFPLFTVTDCLFLGVFGGILGPLGDLCESMLKRAYGVKDSGRAMPGHGGILDRIDALVFNAPLTFVYVTFLRNVLS